MRGSNEFEIMEKGYMADFIAKGDGTSSDTMPPEASGDVTDKAKVDKVKASGKEGGSGKSDQTTEMAEDLSLVEEGAKKDIADGYVADCQGDKVSTAKGFDEYNARCASGIVAKDYGFNRDNPRDTVRGIVNGVVEKMAPGPGKVYGPAGGKVAWESRQRELADKAEMDKAAETGRKIGRGIKNVGQFAKQNAGKLALGAGALGAGALGINYLAKKKED
jgi:hypothetical protein